MRLLRHLPLVLLSSVLSASLNASHIDHAKLDAHISQFIKAKEKTPGTGVAVAILKDGSVIYEKGFGYRDREKKMPVTEHTRFAIGSVTKSFTALSLKMLEHEGRVDLLKPVKEYLPDFELNIPNIGAQVTLEDMLSHRTGLPRHDSLFYFTNKTREELFHSLPFLEMNARPQFGFRVSFQYNNLMYMVAGMVLEHVYGKTWKEYVQKNLFDTLGMTDSSFSYDTASQSTDFAKPYAGETALPVRNIDAIDSAGAIFSNLKDMEKWIQLMLNKGKMQDGSTLAPTAVMEDMWKMRSRGGLSKDIRFTYGLAWMLMDLQGREITWHGGHIDGYSAFVSFHHESKIGMIVLCNENESMDMTTPVRVENGKFVGLPYYIYDLLFNEEKLDAEIENWEANGSPEHGSLDTWKFDPFGTWNYVGTYEDDGYGELTITEKNGALFLEMGSLKMKIDGYSNDVFLGHTDTSPKIPLPVIFERHNDRIRSLSITLEAHAFPIKFRKKSQRC